MEGFADISEVLGGGVYVLCHRGEVMFVGAARNGSMLAKIATARSSDRPKFFPKIPFDQVWVKYVHPDKIDAVKISLIAEHNPRYNLATLPLHSLPTVVRRV